MKSFTPTLGSLLLATSALVAPQIAVAQQAPTPVPAPAPAEEATEVEEIIVRGVNIPQPMRETSEVASFLSVEDLKRQGDDTAAEALTRLSGLSVVSGKFVYVRGLGERYSSALLNGSPLPSPEPLQRVVPLDLFPSNILAGTSVQKTYSVNYGGEFGGGVIDLRTTKVPNEPFFSMSASFGGNTETTFKEGITYYGSATDGLGYDDGARELPKPLQAAIETGNRITSGVNFTDNQLVFIGSSFVNAPMNLIQIKNQMPGNFSVDLSGGTSFEVPGGTLGLLIVGGFDNSWRSRFGTQQEGQVGGGIIAPVTDYEFRSTQNDVVVNALVGVGYDMGDHIFSWTNLYIHTTTKEARIRSGYNDLTGADVRDDYTEWFERSLISTQLTGEHDLGDLEIDWRGAFARTARNSPYEKGIRYRLVGGEYLHNASQEQNYTRFGEVEDQLASFGVDAAYTVALSNARDVIFSGGVAWSDNERAAEQREFRLLALNVALPIEVQRQRVDYLLADYNIGPGALMIRETSGSDGAAAYEAALTVKAVYFQADAEIIPLVRATVGLRYEDAIQSVTPTALFAGDPVPFAPAPLENQYILPAATLTWNFYEEMQLRVGLSKTIARPQFRELAPLSYLDPDTDRLFIGNPNLVDSELINFDVRYEWYFSRDEYLTLGLFYKDIDKPVEAIVNEVGATVQTTFLNAPRASLYGVEVDVKTYFEFFSDTPWFSAKRWLAAANYTYSRSELIVEAGDEVFPLTVDGSARPAVDFVNDGDPMQGQSEHLLNVQFGFEDDTARSQATFLVSYASERITTRGRTGFPDLTQEPGVILDFTYRRDFTVWDQDVTFGIEARNLLKEDYEEFQELGGGRVDNNTYELGSSFSVSLSTRF